MNTSGRGVLVIDFGSQYTHLICRRFRELQVFSEIRAHNVSLEEVRQFAPVAVVLSGGPSSVYAENAPRLRPEVWAWLLEEHTPLLGVCYGQQLLVQELGGKVVAGEKREYGSAVVTLTSDGEGVFEKQTMNVWMSHGDKVVELPEGFRVLGVSSNSEYCMIGHEARNIYGVQFHPEVSHTEGGINILRVFARLAHCPFTWTMDNFVHQEIEELQASVLRDPEAFVVGAVSGGVDSTVAAALVHKALGKERFMAVMVDTGLLRHEEAAEVKERLEREIGNGFELTVVDASEQFFAALKDVSDPERKRKIIGGLFIDVFEQTVRNSRLSQNGDAGMAKGFLLQGTLYPDVIESTAILHGAAIKSHHNVGGLPAKMKLRVLEPLRLLFKDEVRAMGRALGLCEDTILMRHPFPGPGLAIRIMGAVDERRTAMLRAADKIYVEELRKSGEYRKIGQAFAVLLPDVKTVGIMGDKRTYECLCALRAVASEDFMTADFHKFASWDVLGTASRRIVNEVPGINRVVYDVTSKPPATIEWE